jgi:hypothetical protein
LGGEANTSGNVEDKPASVRIFHRELPPITGDRRPNITLPILLSRMA